MLYVLTGDDTVSSRKKLSELLEFATNVVSLDGKKVGVGEVEMALKSGGLFSDKKIVVVEHFLKVKPLELLIELATNFVKDENTIFILWDEVEPSSKIKNSLKSVNSFSFAFPKVYFTFMDGLVPANSTKSIETLGEVLKTYEPEQILYSIIKRVRQLLLLKSQNFLEFEEFAKMGDWQIGKLKQQASRWRDDQLKKAFLSYTELDEKIKTGGLTLPLASHLDILLASDLN